MGPHCRRRAGAAERARAESADGAVRALALASRDDITVCECITEQFFVEFTSHHLVLFLDELCSVISYNKVHSPFFEKFAQSRSGDSVA